MPYCFCTYFTIDELCANNKCIHKPKQNEVLPKQNGEPKKAKSPKKATNAKIPQKQKQQVKSK